MLRVVPYRPEHYFMLHDNPEQVANLLGMNDVNKIAEKFLRGPAFSGFYRDQIIASGGVIILWPGVGEAWAKTSDLVHQYPKWFHKTIKLYLEHIGKIYKLVRIQAMVVKDFERARKWAERLGFEYEGEMKKYMGGKDYVRYALIRGD